MLKLSTEGENKSSMRWAGERAFQAEGTVSTETWGWREPGVLRAVKEGQCDSRGGKGHDRS